MRIISARVALVCAAMMLTGCAHYATGRYTIATDNAVALRSMSGMQVNVGAFTDAKNTTEISCHMHGPVSTLDGETFASFIRKAFVDELKMSGVYSASAPVTVSGRLDTVDYKTAFGTEWDFTVTLTASNGKTATVTETYVYRGSKVRWDAGGECEQVALAFVPGVQNLVGKMIAQLPMLTSDTGGS